MITRPACRQLDRRNAPTSTWISMEFDVLMVLIRTLAVYKEFKLVMLVLFHRIKIEDNNKK